MLSLAKTSHAAGKLDEAAAKYSAIIAEYPENIESQFLLGLLEGQRKNFDLAAESLTRVVTLDPAHTLARTNLGRAYRAMGKIDEAIREFDLALDTNPTDAEALFAKATTLLETQQFSESIELYDRLLTTHPRNAAAWANRGGALQALGKTAESLQSFQNARECNPTIPEYHVREGELLLAFGKDQDAREAFDRAVQINPNLATAHLGRAAALMKRHNVVSAMLSADRARQINPRSAEAHRLLGCGQMELGHLEQAIRFFDVALELKPEYPEVLFAKGEALQEVGRHDEATAVFEQLVALQPEMRLAKGSLLHAKMRAADWGGLDSLTDDVIEQVRQGTLAINPFGLQPICDDEATLLTCAELTTKHFHPPASRKLARPRQRRGGKIKIGYVSGEFCEHATSILMTGVWEKHDKTSFEIIGIDTGLVDQSPRRQRIDAAFDRIVPVTDISDNDAALRIAALEIDVLVNLNGFFGKARPGIFAMRPARVQVNYLGFPGTLGAEYMDYLIADHIVIPESSQRHYRENIVYLPGCYQPNDDTREISPEPITRSAYELPEDAVVFCCFNNIYKITPVIFSKWMEILKSVPKSVIWLLESSDQLRDRLRSCAAEAGIDPTRIVFAAHAPGPVHLARHRLADLFLDTTPYNAHTTASDALWAGLPILTVRGSTFPGRVAESLLTSVGLNRLIATNLDEYRNLAIRLGSDKAELMNLKEQLAAALPKADVFNTAKTTRNLEAAFRYMVEQAENGL